MGSLNQSKPIMLSLTTKQRRDSPGPVRVIVFCACKIKVRSGRACFWSSFKWLHSTVKWYWSDYSSSPSCKLSFSSASFLIIPSPGCLTQTVRTYKRGMQYRVAYFPWISIPIVWIRNHSFIAHWCILSRETCIQSLHFLVCAFPGNQTHYDTVATVDFLYYFHRKGLTSTAIHVNCFICSNLIWNRFMFWLSH